MQPLTYDVDLHLRDFAAIQVHAYGGWKGHRGWSLVTGVAVFVAVAQLLRFVFAPGWLLTLGASAPAGIAAALLALHLLRARHVRRVRTYFVQPPYDQVTGRLTITLDDDGIAAKGSAYSLSHRWPAIHFAAATPSWVFVHTIHTSVYVIPLRFVPDADALRAVLAERVPLFLKDDPSLWEAKPAMRRLPGRNESAANALTTLMAAIHASGNHEDAVRAILGLLAEAAPPAADVTALRTVVDGACRQHVNEQIAAGEATCSFCARPWEQAFWFIQGVAATICDRCIRDADAYVALGELRKREPGSLAHSLWKWTHRDQLKLFDARTREGGA